MEQTRTIQTAFRIRPDLLQKAKLRARAKGMSLNSYVEEVLEQDLSSSDRYENVRAQLKGSLTMNENTKPSFPIMDCGLRFGESINLGQFWDDKELEGDPKLEHIVNKHAK